MTRIRMEALIVKHKVIDHLHKSAIAFTQHKQMAQSISFAIKKISTEVKSGVMLGGGQDTKQDYNNQYKHTLPTQKQSSNPLT